MIQMLNNKEKFKLENLESWYKNTDYWLTHPLRQVVDTQFFFKEKLKRLIEPNMYILDMGCGNAWLLEYIIELDLPFTYKGIDFNQKFIRYLDDKYHSMPNVSFELIDFEIDIPIHLINQYDLVFNCFNFFETANIDIAFSNAVKMIKRQGKLIIFTIETAYLILGISRDMAEFKANLKMYEDIKSKGEVPYFFQNIDLGDSESTELKYASVLYSLDDYFKKAKQYNICMDDYGEVVKTSKYIPKTYQYIVFRKYDK